jgi:hypothetical protein
MAGARPGEEVAVEDRLEVASLVPSEVGMGVWEEEENELTAKVAVTLRAGEALAAPEVDDDDVAEDMAVPEAELVTDAEAIAVADDDTVGEGLPLPEPVDVANDEDAAITVAVTDDVLVEVDVAEDEADAVDEDEDEADAVPVAVAVDDGVPVGVELATPDIDDDDVAEDMAVPELVADGVAVLVAVAVAVAEDEDDTVGKGLPLPEPVDVAIDEAAAVTDADADGDTDAEADTDADADGEADAEGDGLANSQVAAPLLRTKPCPHEVHVVAVDTHVRQGLAHPQHDASSQKPFPHLRRVMQSNCPSEQVAFANLVNAHKRVRRTSSCRLP